MTINTESEAVSEPTAPEGIERSTQLLPIPLGGLAPARAHASRRMRLWRNHQAVGLVMLGLVATATGVLVATMPRSFEVGANAAGVRVDDLNLTKSTAQTIESARIFTGAASLVIFSVGTTVHAAAVMTWNGFPATGRCVLQMGLRSPSERCVFMLGSTRFASVDTFSAVTRNWHRQYSDGMEVVLTVPSGNALVPIPFPLGR